MDIALAYTEAGSGFPLVLLHGNGEDRGYFAPQIAPFSAVRRVLAVDTRGHGCSPRGNMPFTLAQFAYDLAAFLDERGIAQADLLGFSDGGNIALLFALRWPWRVRRLILCGANLFPAGMNPSALAAIRLIYAGAGLAAPLLPRARRTRDLFRLMAREPHIDPAQLRRLAIPALVVAGTRDLIRARHTRLIADSLPGARLLYLPGGHTVSHEQPEAFNDAVLAFLAEEAQ